ncbi:hypothetical protein GALMADRAFT_462491 [Galerina marginata CBS 339.88]|uniref:Uncharacterized protein n=1 Tax=Galerina marginata (strain CBS 339.88) TaxID=685588 RepID=A0A067T897_GALM3|nr:hypothetical protein GALMADRAFT_462491 [Galerina marginata CBS 339.88]
MATPSSSATSPSPPMPYLHHGPPSQQGSMSSATDAVEQEQRKKAVQKFLARAEVAMVTRALRARLSYASYKATHNIPHVPLRDLEAQSQSQTASFNRTIAAKRKAVGASNHYNNPATQGPSSSGAGNVRRGGSGTMPPPSSTTSPRLHHPPVNGTTAYPTYNDAASSFRNASQVPSLYSSILAPPPTKQARTIHNPSDPPVSPPSRPAPSPRSRVPKSSPRNEPARSQGKAKQAAAKAAKTPASPDKRRTKGSSIDKGKRKQRADDMDVDGDVDMKAAAALTSLLMHHRPSIAGSASSPRSSIDGGSEVGSAYSYSHFAQSSARNSVQSASTTLSAAPSISTIAAEPGPRTQTPPPPAGGSNIQHTTPRAAPTDSEAANLMLFLATSPSPVRPANKDAKDMAAYRALGGGTGPLRSKGRVLFPSTTAGDPAPSGHQDVPAASGGTSYAPPVLIRGGDNSFTSSISSIGGELGGGSNSIATESQNSQSMSTLSGAGSSASSGSVSQLLPPAPLPLPTAPSSPTGRKSAPPNPRSNSVGISGGNGSAGTLEFNFSEFINASPSSPGRSAHGHGTGGMHKPNLGLRADVGRKLFEEEQMRHAHALQAAAAAAAVGPAQRHEERTLGAGIDLIQS